MTGYAEQDGHWKVLNVEAVRKFDAAQRAEGVKMLYYGCTSCTADHNPTYNLYERVWASSFAASYANINAATGFRPAWVPYRLAAVCPGDRSFQQFMLYYGDKFFRECGVPGLYTDTDTVMACDTNRLPRDQKVSVHLDLAKLGLKGQTITATDERIGKTVPLEQGRLTVPVKGRDYSLVSLEGR